MKRRFFMMFLLAFSSLLAMASGLEVTEYPFGQIGAYYPIEVMHFKYSCRVSVEGAPVASVYHNDELVATGTVSVQDGGGNVGYAVVLFDTPLVLPKGEQYTMVIGKDVIAAEDNPEITNDEIRYTFHVPENLDPATFEGISNYGKSQLFTFYWGMETSPVGEPYALLCRNGKAVRQYPLHVGWDWDLGQAYVDFRGELKFEQGVQFSLVIPEGMVCCAWRDDIVNKEVEAPLSGECKGQLPTIAYKRCDLFNRNSLMVLFYYDKDVALVPNSVIQLVEADNETKVIKEVVPALAEKGGECVLTADFGECAMESTAGYAVVIPEATLVSATGDIIVNARNVIPVDFPSDISEVGRDALRISVKDGNLSVENIPEGGSVRLYTMDGRSVGQGEPSAGSFSMRVPTAGMYLVSVNGEAYKVKVE